MLREVLAQYLARVEQIVLQCRQAYVEHYTEEILTPQRANLRLRLRFAQGHLLEINEAVVVEADRLVPLDYRYHCQDAHHQLLFRYDSTPHFPGLANFPHHKHRSHDVIGCEKPDIEQVVHEAIDAQP